jgi:hypothetical protein
MPEYTGNRPVAAQLLYGITARRTAIHSAGEKDTSGPFQSSEKKKFREIAARLDIGAVIASSNDRVEGKVR